MSGNFIASDLDIATGLSSWFSVTGLTDLQERGNGKHATCETGGQRSKRGGGKEFDLTSTPQRTLPQTQSSRELCLSIS